MAADVLDPTSPAINEFLLEIRSQLRDAERSDRFGTWEGVLPFQPKVFKELESGNRFKKRLTAAI